MPIKPPNQSRNVPVDASGFVGRRKRDNKKDYSQMNSSPQTYKTDREPLKADIGGRAAKGDRQPIFDQKGFKDKLNEAMKDFDNKIKRKKK